MNILISDTSSVYYTQDCKKKDMKFHIRKDDITSAAWEIFQSVSDENKYDLIQNKPATSC